MDLQTFKTLKIDDDVIVTVDVKDAYQETWHEKGERVKIKKFTSDGVGVIFHWSDLGVNYKKIEKP